MLPRTLEPEVMDTAEEAADYDSMDHTSVNQVFVDDVFEAASETGLMTPADSPGLGLRVLDAGTGTAQIPIELCRRPLQADLVAIDLAVEMLRLAEQNIREAGLHGTIQLEHADAKDLPFDDAEFDWCLSNSIMHHIPEPVECLREMQRVLKPGGLLFVRDLLRPESEAEIEQLVDAYAADANDHQRQLFRQSFHAALTVPEVREMAVALNLPADSVRQTTDRHWTLCTRLQP